MAYGMLKAVGAMVVAGAIGIGGWSYATAWHPKVSQYPLQGIDLDERPGPIEWGTVRARGADFAYLVATSGADRRERQDCRHSESGAGRSPFQLYSCSGRRIPNHPTWRRSLSRYVGVT